MSASAAPARAALPAAAPLSAPERDLIRAQLERILRRGSIALHRPESTDYHGDIVDRAAATSARVEELAALERSSNGLREAASALALLDSNPAAFDRCEGCGGMIGFARLDFLPSTRICSHCAS